MRIAGLASARGLAVGLAAGGAGIAALLHRGDLRWGALWPVVVLAACHGYGRVLDRAVGRRLGTVATTLCGLAVLVLGSVVLGRLGLLGLGVQLGAVALGLLCCGLAAPAAAAAAADEPDLSGPDERGAELTGIAGIAGGAALVAALAVIAIARLDLVIADGLNHTFVLKRLWDTGALDRLPHQLGAEPVAESYLAIVAGAHAPAILQAAVAPALLIALLLERLAAHRSRIALAVGCVLAIPIALVPTLTTQWLAALLHAGAFFALTEAIAARRIGWHAIACALALIATRHEYGLLALPYLAAAILLPLERPRSRRGSRALAIGWVVALVGFQLVLAAPVTDALVNAALLLAAWPFARALLGLLGAEPPPGAVAVLCFAASTWGLAVVLDAVRPAQHAPEASIGVWIAVALCVAAAPAWYAAAGPARPRLHPEIVAAVLALFLAGAVIAPNFAHVRRSKLVGRLSAALIEIKYRRATGDGLRAHRDLRALQERLPAGAVLGFWGQSAAELDFGRNRIVDLSWPVNKHRDELYLQPIELRSLRGKDHVLVELVEPAPATPATYVPWTIPHATVGVEGALELVACIDAACAFAVRR